MVTKENRQEERGLDRLLSECFAGGELLRRELRLTGEQASVLAQRYPAAVRPMGENWYEISFQEAYHCYGN